MSPSWKRKEKLGEVCGENGEGMRWRKLGVKDWKVWWGSAPAHGRV